MKAFPHTSRRSLPAAWLLIALGAALGGCGEGDAAPLAQSQTLAILEDQALDGEVWATDLLHRKVTYAVAEGPRHGALSLDPETGRFSYQPDPDFNGQDAFRFTASNGTLASEPATVSIAVQPVNDAPRLEPIPDQANSAETLETFVAVRATDVDGDPLQYTVAVADPAVAATAVDATGTLVLTPLARGGTAVTITVSDGTVQATTTFTFTVGDAIKLRRWTVDQPRAYAVSIRNTSDREVSFELRHNGALLATTGDQLVAEVRALADEVPGEPFERKLWRFVRDESYHFDPMTAAYWQHDPLLFLNSVGFGFCDDVTAVYVSLARAAGYTARGWDLHGHVVPEVQVGGRWSMYDPDLAVYYLERDGSVADVATLAADSSLIVSPFERVSSWYFPYTSDISDIYATTADNFISTTGLGNVTPRDTGQLRLPVGAGITYPGRWAAQPVGYWGSTITVTAQLRLDLPAGFHGLVDWPLVPWDVQGSGRVRWNGVEYAAGSPELTAALQDVLPARAPASGIEILDSPGLIALVFLLNPMRFSLTQATEISVRSLDAWALALDLVAHAAASAVSYDWTASVTRPR